MSPTSGAVDFVRSRWLRPSPGCVLAMVHRSDGTLRAFLSKFTSQAYVTDNEGHPA